jgi:thioredoxin-related protein
MLFKCYFQIFILILTLVITGQFAPIIQIDNTEIKPVNPSETKRLESQATLKVVLVVYKHYCKYSNQFHQG